MLVTARSDIARESDWTVIVAKRLTMRGGPQLYINARYRGSEVKPPQGVGPGADDVRLLK